MILPLSLDPTSVPSSAKTFREQVCSSLRAGLFFLDKDNLSYYEYRLGKLHQKQGSLSFCLISGFPYMSFDINLKNVSLLEYIIRFSPTSTSGYQNGGSCLEMFLELKAWF